MASQGITRLNMGHLAALQKKYQSVSQKAENIKKKADKAIGQVVRTGIVSATAFGLGAVQGRTGGVELPGGITLDLAVGVTAHGLGLFGIGGTHLHSVGDGAMATFFATMGRGQGKKWLAKVNEERANKGELPTGEGIKLLDLGKKKPGEETVNVPRARSAR